MSSRTFWICRVKGHKYYSITDWDNGIVVYYCTRCGDEYRGNITDDHA